MKFCLRRAWFSPRGEIGKGLPLWSRQGSSLSVGSSGSRGVLCPSSDAT
eukprot:CAMPEP_0173404152 /NCGR_PEP_ID=MMETSP1356-20130122/58654_1 /TAXON_ID=77927 ORGANISM="Hemiselmis virescens, Strain PCC157" /NCGR_SAMPLE_ID=MMETSP1356 /ASSEMBLY_ACC=CAM_ASM_000847 /LENGTH=48 /DNA_ID= /DNA_START= /DNA_END= /DNA_ORIENTATION=